MTSSDAFGPRTLELFPGRTFWTASFGLGADGAFLQLRRLLALLGYSLLRLPFVNRAQVTGEMSGHRELASAPRTFERFSFCHGSRLLKDTWNIALSLIKSDV